MILIFKPVEKKFICMIIIIFILRGTWGYIFNQPIEYTTDYLILICIISLAFSIDELKGEI